MIFSVNGTINITELSPEQFKSTLTTESMVPAESESDLIADQLKTGAFPLTLLVFLGLGILLAFTPCVLPMVPILANILVGEYTPLSSRRATLLASLYVLSVAFCYAVAGVLAGVMGDHLQAALQKPIFLLALSFLLLVFALGQFNLIRIHLPQIFVQRLHQLQHKQKQGSVFGAVSMGAISALMASPCVTPALVGALTYIGQTGNAILGGFALFFMALGMGLPLLVVACIGSHLLPKAGRWMHSVKIITGVFLLLLAGSLIHRAYPHAFHHNDSVIAERFTRIQTEQELKIALYQAQSLKKNVLLDVYADWCISCQQLDQELFNNPSVLESLKDFKLLRLDMTKITKDNETLVRDKIQGHQCHRRLHRITHNMFLP